MTAVGPFGPLYVVLPIARIDAHVRPASLQDAKDSR